MSRLDPAATRAPFSMRRISAGALVALAAVLAAPLGAAAARPAGVHAPSASWTDRHVPRASWTDGRAPNASWTDAVRKRSRLGK